jgi:hypothetical protein
MASPFLPMILPIADAGTISCSVSIRGWFAKI